MRSFRPDFALNLSYSLHALEKVDSAKSPFSIYTGQVFCWCFRCEAICGSTAVVDKLPEGKTTVRQQIFRRLLLKILAAAALLGILTATSSRLSSGSVSTSVIGMFPKSTSEFAYADLKGARKLTWFGQMQDQMLPAHMRQFEQFLASA